MEASSLTSTTLLLSNSSQAVFQSGSSDNLVLSIAYEVCFVRPISWDWKVGYGCAFLRLGFFRAALKVLIVEVITVEGWRIAATCMCEVAGKKQLDCSVWEESQSWAVRVGGFWRAEGQNSMMICGGFLFAGVMHWGCPELQSRGKWVSGGSLRRCWYLGWRESEHWASLTTISSSSNVASE